MNLLFPTFSFISRRLFIAGVIVFASFFPALQVQVTLATSVITMIYSCNVKPFTDKKMNYIDMFNEWTIMLMAYATIPYSDFLADPYFKYQIGWLVLGGFLLNLFINIGFIVLMTLINIFRKIKAKCKANKIKKKQKKFQVEKEAN